MRRMNLEEGTILQIYETVSLGKSYATRQELIQGIVNYAQCSIPTAYKLLYFHKSLFYVDGENKWRPVFEVAKDTKTKVEILDFTAADKFLDKVVQFVASKPSSDDFLILVGTSRDQLRDGVWNDYDTLLVLLEQKFGDEVGSLIEEGKVIRETEGKRTEAVVPKTEGPRQEAPKEETVPEEASKMVEILQVS